MNDAIILYENGKAIGGEGHPTYARDITFENEGTDLVSEEVESAIKEVDAKTKHGFYEVWENSAMGATFAGQSIDILTDKVFDSFLVESGRKASVLTQSITMVEVGGSAQISLAELSPSNSKVYHYIRTVSVSAITGGYRFTFSDGTERAQNSTGSAATVSTNNNEVLPYRILGLIHES